MKLYFCLLYLEIIIHVLCTFLCAVLITGLCGICVGACFSWPHCLGVRGRHAQRGVTKGKCKSLFFFCLISSVFFLLWLLFGFIKQYRIFFFLFVGLMKTIHVNITIKKNVYFYDFWVITLSFANKIFNDNLTDLVAFWFENKWRQLYPILNKFRCDVSSAVCFYCWETFHFIYFCRSSTSPELMLLYRMLMESDKVRASLHTFFCKALYIHIHIITNSASVSLPTKGKFDSCQKV